MKPNALDIPEIVGSIAGYLSRHDQVRCLRVSSTFHAVFIPIVWRKISLIYVSSRHPGYNYPTGASLDRHKHHIQELKFWGAYPPEYLYLRGCLGLQTIHTVILHSVNYQHTLSNLPRLIEAHSSTIRKIIVDPQFVNLTTPPTVFFDALIQCTHLTELSIGNLRVTDELLPSFFQVCALPSILILQRVAIPDWPRTDFGDASIGIISVGMSDVFPSLRRLTVTNDGSYAPLPSHSQSAQARLVRCCPNLEALYWRIGGEVEVISASQVTFVQDPGAKEFCSALSKDPWVLPFLDSLDLSWMRVEDEDFATLFKQLNRLKSFTAANTKVGPCWFQALTVHRTNRSTGLCRCLCDTIETLKLEKCQYITSAMVQTFLERCPKLKILCAPTITVTDIAQGKDWVSRDMVELSTHIELDVDSDADGTKFQLIAYSRLAALTKLKNLTLSIQGHGEPKKTLDLRLKAGLSLLETLKNLQSFTFLSEWQQNMEVDEAKWVVEHWPKLKFFRGRPTHDPVTRVLMGRILLARGVILIDYDL